MINMEKLGIEDGVRMLIEIYKKEFPENEIHSILVYGKFNPVEKVVEYSVYADVREKGQIFLGMSS